MTQKSRYKTFIAQNLITQKKVRNFNFWDSFTPNKSNQKREVMTKTLLIIIGFLYSNLISQK